MARVAYTIWALLLNTFGFPIFQTCFENAMENEECESVLSGLPMTVLLFNSGVYTIIVRTNLYPSSLRKPENYILAIYEFLACAFILEFATACIWAPIDVLFYTTARKKISKIMHYLGPKYTIRRNEGNDQYKIPMAIALYGITLGFFLLALHVSDVVDFARLKEEIISIKNSSLPQLVAKVRTFLGKTEAPVTERREKRIDRCRCTRPQRPKRTRTPTRRR